MLLQGLLHVLGAGEAELHQDLPQRLGPGQAFLHLQGLLQRFPGELALLDQDLPQAVLLRVGPAEELLPGLGEGEVEAGGPIEELGHRLLVPGVGEDHLHLPVLEADGHGAVTQGVGTEEEEGGGGVGDDPLGAFQKLQPLLLRQGPVKGLLGEPLPHQDPPEEVPRLLLFHQGLLQGLAGDPPLLQEELPELEVLLALARRRRGTGRPSSG